MSEKALCYRSILPLVYREFMEALYPDLECVRQMKKWQILASPPNAVPLLFIAQHDVRVVYRCEYASVPEQQRDMEYWRQLPPGGGEADGVAARPVPGPPSRTAGHAMPFPPNAATEPRSGRG